MTTQIRQHVIEQLWHNYSTATTQVKQIEDTLRSKKIGLPTLDHLAIIDLPGNNVLLALKINQDRPTARMVQGVPSISTRQIVTNVQLKNGQTIVLGGIFEINNEKTQESIPFLGNLPVVGVLFKQQNKRHQKRELLVFVTPKIMPQAI